MAKLRTLIANVQRVPSGFYKVYKETTTVLPLMYKNDSQPLTRRELEALTSNYETLQKLGLLFFMQLPPVIGTIPALIAVRYPRALLTNHFWSEEQKNSFARDQMRERSQYSTQLLQSLQLINDFDDTITSNSSSDSITIHSNIDMNAVNLAVTDRKLTLNSLKGDHLRLLSGANAINSSLIAQNYAPSPLLRSWLGKRAAYIQQDDHLLMKEGLADLTIEELHYALLKRGIYPFDTTEDVMRSRLSQWLDEFWIRTNTEILAENSAEKDLGHSILLHSMAVNSLKNFKELPIVTEEQFKQ